MTVPLNQGSESGEIAEGSVQYVVRQLEALVNEIVAGRAVVYIGAGVSMSAGLVSWNGILASLQKEAKGRLQNEDKIGKAHFERLVGQTRSLEIGDWMRSVIEPVGFYNAIKSKVSHREDGGAPIPSPIHQNLARLPFSMAITTNYDRLLEDAYRAAGVENLTELTWMDINDVLAIVKKPEFQVVHAHGIIGREKTIVLSGSQYASQHHGHPLFGDLLKWLLKTRTFLFVGASLEDPDLIFCLQELKSEHGEQAGQHYVLLPFDEAPPRRIKLLRENLNLIAIPVGTQQQEDEAKEKDEPKAWLTPTLSAILRELSGQVALKNFDRGLPGFPTSDDPCFCLQHFTSDFAQRSGQNDVTRLMEIFACQIVPGSHGSEELRYAISTTKTDPRIRNQKVAADSICGIAYYQATAEYGVYVTNVEKEELYPTSRLGHYGKISYRPGYPEVRSELAIPIEADGVRVGVLNLESNLIDAYSDDHHRKAARKFAEKAGRLYAAAHERKRRGRRLAPERTEPAYDKMREICESLWRIARDRTGDQLELAVLIYHADYQSGLLIAQNPVGTILPPTADASTVAPCFEFHNDKNKNRSLAARVFLDGRPYAYPDAEEAILQDKLPVEVIHGSSGSKDPSLAFLFRSTAISPAWSSRGCGRHPYQSWTEETSSCSVGRRT